MWWLKSTCNSRSGVSSALFWLLRAPAHSWCIHMRALTHNNTQNIKFKVMKEYIKHNVIRLHKETTGHSGTSSSLWFTAESVNYCVLLWFPLSSVLPAPDKSWADVFISWFPFEISTRVGQSLSHSLLRLHFLDSPLDTQEVFASDAHLLPVIKIRRPLGTPAFLLLWTRCWDTSVISNHPSGDGSCCLPEGLVSWLTSYHLIIAFLFPLIRSHPSSDLHSLLFLLSIRYHPPWNHLSSSSSLRTLSASRWTSYNYFLLLPMPLPRPHLLTFSSGPPSVRYSGWTMPLCDRSSLCSYWRVSSYSGEGRQCMRVKISPLYPHTQAWTTQFSLCVALLCKHLKGA